MNKDLNITDEEYEEMKLEEGKKFLNLNRKSLGAVKYNILININIEERSFNEGNFSI
jgi:hypothetical protein